MSRASISVVVANYNHGRFLPRCLEGIASQTMLPLEVIVVDDASQDDSVTVIERYADRLRNFRLVKRERNKGVIATMNEGLELARGTHVLFAAADDWIEPWLLQQAHALLEQHPEAGVCSGLTRLANEAGEVIGVFQTQLPQLHAGYIEPQRVQSLLIEDDGWFNGNTTIVNRAAAIAAGGYRGQLRSFTDMFLNMTLAQRSGACFVPCCLAVWRRMDSGYAASLQVNSQALLDVMQQSERLMREEGFSPIYIARWAARWRFNLGRSVLKSSRGASGPRLSDVLPASYNRRATAIEAIRDVPRVGALISVALLFVVLRPKDILPVLRRNILWLLFRARLEKAPA